MSTPCHDTQPSQQARRRVFSQAPHVRCPRSKTVPQHLVGSLSLSFTGHYALLHTGTHAVHGCSQAQTIVRCQATASARWPISAIHNWFLNEYVDNRSWIDCDNPARAQSSGSRCFSWGLCGGFPTMSSAWSGSPQMLVCKSAHANYSKCEAERESRSTRLSSNASLGTAAA